MLYNASMSRTIVRAKESDYRDLVSIYSLTNEAMDPKSRLSEESQERLLSTLGEAIENDRAFIVKDGSQAIAFALVSHTIDDVFFPDSHSFSKANALLDAIDHTGENVMVLQALYVLPNKQRHNVGGELLLSLVGRYKDSSWLTWNVEGNLPATSFLLRHSFVILDRDFSVEAETKPLLVLCRKYRPTGLCREAFW